MAPFVGILRAAGLAKEVSVGTLNATPDAYLPYIPPDTFWPQIQVLESMGTRFSPDKVIKADQGPGIIKGAKVKIEVEPENIGQILLAALGADVVTGSGVLGYTHTMKRAAVSQLPTYTWWFDKGLKFPQFTGSMLNKLDINIKNKEYVIADTDWTALGYDNTGTSKSPTYSPYRSFLWDQATVTVDGVGNLNYDNLQISIDNHVAAEHALAPTIYTTKIWTEGMRVTMSADLYFEDVTQLNKFLAGTTAHFNVLLTSTENIPGSSPLTPFTLAFDMPIVHYTAAPLHNPTGVLKVPFAGVCRFDSVAGYSIQAALKNSVSAAY